EVLAAAGERPHERRAVAEAVEGHPFAAGGIHHLGDAGAGLGVGLLGVVDPHAPAVAPGLVARGRELGPSLVVAWRGPVAAAPVDRDEAALGTEVGREGGGRAGGGLVVAAADQRGPEEETECDVDGRPARPACSVVCRHAGAVCAAAARWFHSATIADMGRRLRRSRCARFTCSTSAAPAGMSRILAFSASVVFGDLLLTRGAWCARFG